MDIEQRLEVLCQIIRDYDLMGHIDNNRRDFEKSGKFKAYDIGSDLALLDTIAHGTGLYPVNYEMAMMRAHERLGLLEGMNDGPESD